MLFSSINGNTNTSRLLRFNMPPSPRGNAKRFTKARDEENFATSRATRAHVTGSDLQTPLVVSAERSEGRASERHWGFWKPGSSVLPSGRTASLSVRPAERFRFAGLRTFVRRSGVFGSH